MQFSPTLNAIVAGSAPHQQGDTTYAMLFYTVDNPGEQKYDVRLAAVDINGVEHDPAFQGGGWASSGGSTLARIRPEYNLPLEDIAAFDVQVRARTRVEFRNVSLRPGEHRTVKVITTEAPRPTVAKVEKQVRVPEGFANWRDYSSQVLAVFHATCVDYLNEHAETGLPKKPWLLKFRFPDHQQRSLDGQYHDVCVSYLQYVTYAGYFRPGGFTSLKREDFDSNEASRTPILYCKCLLKRDNGKRTCVLFGDGRIEYVTVAELEELKAAFDDSKGKM